MHTIAYYYYTVKRRIGTRIAVRWCAACAHCIPALRAISVGGHNIHTILNYPVDGQLVGVNVWVLCIVTCTFNGCWRVDFVWAFTWADRYPATELTIELWWVCPFTTVHLMLSVRAAGVTSATGRVQVGCMLRAVLSARFHATNPTTLGAPVYPSAHRTHSMIRT